MATFDNSHAFRRFRWLIFVYVAASSVVLLGRVLLLTWSLEAVAVGVQYSLVFGMEALLVSWFIPAPGNQLYQLPYVEQPQRNVGLPVSAGVPDPRIIAALGLPPLLDRPAAPNAISVAPAARLRPRAQAVHRVIWADDHSNRRFHA